MAGAGQPSKSYDIGTRNGADGGPSAAMTNTGAVATSQTIGAPIPHDSAARHVSGRAIYVDDMPEPPLLLHCVLGVPAGDLPVF